MRRPLSSARILFAALFAAFRGGCNPVTEPHLVQTPGGVASLAPTKSGALGKLRRQEIDTLVCGLASKAGEELLMWLRSGRRSRARARGGRCVTRALCLALGAWWHIVRQCFVVVDGMHDLFDVFASRCADICWDALLATFVPCKQLDLVHRVDRQHVVQELAAKFLENREGSHRRHHGLQATSVANRVEANDGAQRRWAERRAVRTAAHSIHLSRPMLRHEQERHDGQPSELLVLRRAPQRCPRDGGHA